MSTSAKLTLILANGTCEVLHQQQDDSLRMWLARAAGRGVLTRVREEAPVARDHLDCEWHLLGALSLQSDAKWLASAPVCLAGSGVDGFWFRVTPLHFAAGMTRLDAVVLQGAASLTDGERKELGDAIGQYVQSIGLKWDEAQWLIGFTRELNVQTVQPNLAADLERALPSGDDAKELRRLMTELQMVLHEHPVNLRRARAGLPAANAVWLWGGGPVKGRRDNYRSSVKIFATDPFSLGLAFLTGSQVIAPQTPQQLLNDSNSGDAVAVLDLQTQSNLLDWLAALQTALAKGRLRALVIAIDQWSIELTKMAALRFWRRDKPLERWSAT